jgi:hypothetical protein
MTAGCAAITISFCHPAVIALCCYNQQQLCIELYVRHQVIQNVWCLPLVAAVLAQECGS